MVFLGSGLFAAVVTNGISIRNRMQLCTIFDYVIYYFLGKANSTCSMRCFLSIENG
jgi:hypothetical protein